MDLDQELEFKRTSKVFTFTVSVWNNGKQTMRKNAREGYLDANTLVSLAEDFKEELGKLYDMWEESQLNSKKLEKKASNLRSALISLNIKKFIKIAKEMVSE